MVRGGLSEWAHQLISSLSEIEFEIICVMPNETCELVYETPPNVTKVTIKPTISSSDHKKNASMLKEVSIDLANPLKNVLYGKSLNCEDVIRTLERYPSKDGWLTSREYWEFVVDFYKKNSPERPFVEYFWTTFGIYSILLDGIYFARQMPRADIYHSLTVALGGFMGSLAKLLHGSPLIVSEHGLYLNERSDELSKSNISKPERQQIMRFSESLIKTSYEWADQIVPTCHSHTAIERELGADSGKIKVINNGIDCNRFRPGPIRNKTPSVVGCFARVVPIKGITTLIRAARAVLDKYRVDFVVVGEIQDKEYYRECQKLVEELRLQDHFKFIGYADSLEWYHRVDISVLSSISEGMPYTLLESMSCGLPCVCTAVGGIPEVLPDDSVGYLVPPNDPDSLADRICQLLGNEMLRKNIGQQATKLANEKYSSEVMINEYRSLYEGLINGSRFQPTKYR